MRISDWSSDVCSSDPRHLLRLWLVQVPMKMQTGSITSRGQAVAKVAFSKLHQPTRRVVRNKNLDVIGVALSSSVRKGGFREEKTFLGCPKLLHAAPPHKERITPTDVKGQSICLP